MEKISISDKMCYEAKPAFLIHPIELPIEEVNHTIQSIENIWLTMNSTDKKLKLYHYTTPEGLNGILSSRSIRCSHISTLDDKSELQYGKEIILSILNKYKEIEINSSVNNFLKTLIELVDSFVVNLYHVYIACFSEEDDLPKLWKEYASTGKGFNLEISINSETGYSHDLNNIPSKSRPILRKVIYDPNKQNYIVQHFISLMIKSLEEALVRRKNLPPAWDYISALDFVNILFEILISFKKQYYQKEREWRLIQTLKQDQNRYIENFINNNFNGVLEFPVSSIKIGPNAENIKTKDSVNNIVKEIAKLAHPVKLQQEIIIKSSALNKL